MSHAHSCLGDLFRRRLASAAVAALWLCSDNVTAQSTVELRELSLSELGAVVVTSITKEPEELWKTPAAVAVITAEDIRRLGATSLPDVLRSAPGVEVARADSSHWSIGIRGFGEQFSKSLLVLIDGRAIYNPLFAGTYWPAYDVMLEDIERIEIIRGAGGTIWGGNAVTGVINVITKGATATKGALASVTSGTVDDGIAAFRYGGGGDGLDYRVWARGSLRGPQFHEDGVPYDDDWWMTQSGFRVERRGSTGLFTLMGDASTGGHGQRVVIASYAPAGQRVVDDPVDTSGATLQARWAQRAGNTDVQVNTYYEHTDWRAPHFEEARHTFDVDYVQSGTVLPRQHLAWGGGARWSAGTFTQTVPTLTFDPSAQTHRLVSAFVRDEVELVTNRLYVHAGSQFEHNSYTGLELQPTARLLWRATPRHTAWLGAARAVRTPSRIERDVEATSFATLVPLPIFLRVQGSDAFEAERTVALSAGYRTLLGARLLVDITAYHNSHDGLASYASLAPIIETTPSPTRAIGRLPTINGVDGESGGFEVVPEWRPFRRWEMSGSYAYRHFDLRARPENADPNAVNRYEGSTPHHQVGVRSRLDLPLAFELDAFYRFVGALRFRRVDSYHSVDVRLGWRPAPRFDLSVTGHNLLEPHHFEISGATGFSVGVARSVSVKLTWSQPDRP
jgi:iron complex outermembrane recepter protein